MNIFRRGSVRWRIALIYFMLFFVVMSLVSVFLVNRIEQYQLSSLKENIAKTISESNLPSYLGAYDSLSSYGDDIQAVLDSSWSSRDFVKVVAFAGNFLVLNLNRQEVFRD